MMPAKTHANPRTTNAINSISRWRGVLVRQGLTHNQREPTRGFELKIVCKWVIRTARRNCNHRVGSRWSSSSKLGQRTQHSKRKWRNLSNGCDQKRKRELAAKAGK